MRSWSLLTAPKYQSCLKSQHPDGVKGAVVIVVGATFEGKSVGIALCSLMPTLHLAEVHEIFVSEDHRHHSLGTQLLTHLEKELKQERCVMVSVVYPSDEPSTPYFEKILKELGWANPQLFSIHCIFDNLTFFPPWLKEYELPNDFEEFPWDELTDTEHQQLIFRQEQGQFSSSVSPLDNEDTIEPLTSLGLRHRGEVIGWVITHREGQDRLRYTALYIRGDYQLQGHAIKLLCDAILRQRKANIRWGYFDMNIAQSSPEWIKLIKRRLVPYASPATYKKQSWKRL